MSISSFNSLKDMASMASTMSKNKVVLRLDVKNIYPFNNQVRTVFKDIPELAESIKAQGQIQPIVVSPMDDDGRYEIQKGERRWQAHIEAGLTHIDAIVHERPESDLDRVAGQLAENIQRDNLSPLEVATALQAFVDAGWSVNEIAKFVQKGKSYVSARLSLLKMPLCVREIYDAGFVVDVDTLNILRQIFDLDKEKCMALCSLALDQEGIARHQCREILNDMKGKVSQKSPSPTTASETDSPSFTWETDAEQQTPSNSNQDGALSNSNASPLGSYEREAKDAVKSSSTPDESGANVVGQEGADKVDSTVPVDMSKKKDWVNIPNLESLVIEVSIVGEANIRQGLLETSRAATKENHVWVRVISGAGSGKLIMVHVSEVDLKAVSSAGI